MRHVYIAISLHVEVRSADADVDTEAIVRDLRDRLRVALEREQVEFGKALGEQGVRMVTEETPIRAAEVDFPPEVFERLAEGPKTPGVAYPEDEGL
jgi:hypothetical protein